MKQLIHISFLIACIAICEQTISQSDFFLPVSSAALFLDGLTSKAGQATFVSSLNAGNELCQLAFTIESSWSGKWYVYMTISLLIAFFCYLYFRFQQSMYRQKHLLRIINDHQQKLIQSEVVTQERERDRIAKELHDGVGTNLTALKLMVSQLLKNYREPLAGNVEEQFQIVISEINTIIYDLRPPSLERYGLFTVLENHVEKLNESIPLKITLKTFGKEIRLYDINIVIFRVIQELLENSIKHSFAKNVTIHISAFEDIVNLVYEDDGIGFTYDPVQGGLGLDNIESRVRAVNGTLKFESGKFGVSYTIDIPTLLNKEAV